MEKQAIIHDVGSKKEFRRLYDAYSGRIYNYAMTISNGDSYLSEEIMQIVFMKLWEHWHELNNRDKVLSYLFTVAKHTFLNYCEHETVKYLYTTHVLTQEDEINRDTESQIDARFLEAYLRELVDKMPPMRKKVFMLSRYKNMTNKQIAQYLSISEKTVEVHITLALRELRDRLKE